MLLLISCAITLDLYGLFPLSLKCHCNLVSVKAETIKTMGFNICDYQRELSVCVSITY